MVHTIHTPGLVMAELVSVSWWPRGKELKTAVCCHSVEGNAVGVKHFVMLMPQCRAQNRL